MESSYITVIIIVLLSNLFSFATIIYLSHDRKWAKVEIARLQAEVFETIRENRRKEEARLLVITHMPEQKETP